MISLLFIALIGHADARPKPKPQPQLKDFFGTYHGIVHPTFEKNKNLGDVFSLVFDETGVTIPVEMKRQGANEVVRTWTVHYPTETLVTGDGLPAAKAQAGPKALCVGLRATQWSKVTELVCFDNNVGGRASIDFIPLSDSPHLGRAKLMRDRLEGETYPNFDAAMIRETLIRTGIYVDHRPTAAESARVMDIRSIPFEQYSPLKRAQELVELGKGLDQATTAEKFAVIILLGRALHDPVPAIRLLALRQVALYAQHSTFVPSVVGVLLNHDEHPRMQVAAIDAAEQLLEKIAVQVAAQDHLRRYHVQTDPEKLFRKTNGRLDPADLAAVRFLDAPRSFATTWAEGQRDTLVQTLTKLGEDGEVDADVRRRALLVAREFGPSNRDLHDYVLMKSWSPISSPEIQSVSTTLARMYDADREAFFRRAAAVSEDPTFERYFREKLDQLLGDLSRDPRTSHQKRCDLLLGAIEASRAD